MRLPFSHAQPLPSSPPARGLAAGRPRTPARAHQSAGPNQPTGRRLRTAASLRAALALALAAAAAAAQALALFEPLERLAYDLRVTFRFFAGPPSPWAGQIVVVAVDEASLARLGRWPWPAEIHARLLEALVRSTPRAVALDILFQEPPDRESRRRLSDAAARVPNLVLPGGPEAPFSELARAASRLASVRFPVDPDGRIRRLPLPGANARGAPAPLALELARFAKPSLDAGPGASSSVLWMDVRRPPALRRPLRPSDLFAVYSYADVLEGRVPPAQLRNRLVLVGATAPGLVGADRHLLSLAFLGPVPGVLVHANATRALLDGAIHRPVRDGALLTVLLGALLALAGLSGSPVSLAAPLALLAAYTATAFGLFALSGLWIDLAAPGAGLMAVQAAWLVERWAHERGRRRQVEALFGRYVAAPVIDEILRHPEAAHPGGRRHRVTILMADLCGFTALAEREAPERVLEVLNGYLQAMAGPVLEAGGLLDKYLGDGIMAIFGAPVGRPDHAARALECAVEIQRRVAAANRDPAARENGGLPVRIALHGGEAVVGNVGTPERMDYTAIGDTVNLCSRLLERALPGEILLSQEVVAAAGPSPHLQALLGPEELTIRGRQGAVRVFRLRPAPAPEGEVPHEHPRYA